MAQAVKSLQEQLRTELAQVRKTIAPPSGFNVSTKGKMFTFPDGQTSSGPIDAVILDWRTAHTYYQGVYNPQKPEKPACFAIGKILEELTPSKNAPQAQANNCLDCPMNDWGSATTGRGKACKNTRRLAIVAPDATKDTQPWVLNVSPTAIKGFDNFVNKLASMLELMPVQVTTKIGFNPNEAYPTLVFGDPRPHESLELMMHLRQAAQPLLDKEPENNG